MRKNRNFCSAWCVLGRLKVLGNAATLTAGYDRSENENFLNEATLTGSVGKGKVDYELTTKFGSGLDYEVSTKTDDGSAISMEGSVDLLSASDLSVRKVSASKSANLRGNDYDIELSHDLSEGESKIQMSTVLGAGVKATGTLSNKGGAVGKVRREWGACTRPSHYAHVVSQALLLSHPILSPRA